MMTYSPMLTGLFDSKVTWSGFETPISMPSPSFIQSIPRPLFVLQAEYACEPVYIFIAYLAGVVRQFQAIWIAGYTVVAQLVQELRYFLPTGRAQDFDPDYRGVVAQARIDFIERRVAELGFRRDAKAGPLAGVAVVIDVTGPRPHVPELEPALRAL